jgi:hypothetical protein
VNATACRIANVIANACAVSTIIFFVLFIYCSPSSSSSHEISSLESFAFAALRTGQLWQLDSNDAKRDQRMLPTDNLQCVRCNSTLLGFPGWTPIHCGIIDVHWLDFRAKRKHCGILIG